LPLAILALSGSTLINFSKKKTRHKVEHFSWWSWWVLPPRPPVYLD